MTQAIPRERVEQHIAFSVEGLRNMVELLPVTKLYPKTTHAIIANVQAAVIAEGLTARFWPDLAEIVRTYQARCKAADYEPWEFPT